MDSIEWNDMVSREIEFELITILEYLRRERCSSIEGGGGDER
jgi:hypothetical protein